ncbi:MAG TPA: GAF domain-containing protein, partial [Methylomirabilota bacterium]
MARPRSGLQGILTEVARTAAKVCEARDCLIFLMDGDHFRLVAQHGALHYAMGERRPLNRRSALGRAIVEQRTVHVRDMQAAARRFPDAAPAARVTGVRTALATPLLRDRIVVGGLVVRRTVVRPFTPRQISLLKTFASQAAVAIENARLSDELEARNRELAAALERETATSEILRVISGSPTDIQPVLDAVAESAARLCAANDAVILLREGDVLRHVAHHGSIPRFPSLVLPAIRGTAAGRAVLDRQTIHVADLSAEAAEFPEGSNIAREQGVRTILIVPLLRESNAVGLISLRRTEVQPFTATQISLLQTFADQAVIAIENVRLFTELQVRNRELTTSLERETATGAILRAISRSPTDTAPVFDAILESASRLCEANIATLFLFDGEYLRSVAHHNASPAFAEHLRQARLRPSRETSTRLAALERRVVHVHDLLTDSDFAPSDVHRQESVRSVLSVPLLRESLLVGVLTVWRREVRPFTDRHIALLETFADQAVIAIENVRLFNELETRNRELTVALDQQTATSEILRVISSSPTDVQPVFTAIADSAARLCEALDALVFRVDGDVLRQVAHHGPMPAGDVPLHPGVLGGRTVIERRLFHIEDLQAEGDEFPEGSAFARERGHRTILSVPLIRESIAIGVIQLRRNEVRPFSDQQIRLLQTFADQAVIAIENVRLFTELQARNRELTDALEQQTATSEILRVISSSPTDVQPVFAAVAVSAARLCDAYDAAIFLVDGELLRLVAHDGPIPAHAVGQGPPLARGTPPGRAVLDRRAIHVLDMQAEVDEYPEGSAIARRFGHRTVLIVPLLRASEALGAIALRRTEVRPFTDRQVALLQTFADQAIIAIENVRLFNELQSRNRELTEALEQQTATSEILRVISSSPTDVQPVFDAIAGSSARLCGALFSSVYQFDGELIHVGTLYNYPPAALERSQRLFPTRPTRELFTGRAILDRAVVHVPDVEHDQE